MLSRFRRVALCSVAVLALAPITGSSANLNTRLLSPQSIQVLQPDPKKPVNRVLAELKSFLMDQPVTVGIDPRYATAEQERALSLAIDMWQEALHDSPFVIARPNEKPHVIIRFIDRIPGEPSLQGQIEMDRRFNWGKNSHSYRVTAEMDVRDNVRGRMLYTEELGSVIAHELGHLLGLDDVHDARSLMGPFVAGRSSISITRPELEAVKAYRQALKDRIRSFEAKR